MPPVAAAAAAGLATGLVAGTTVITWATGGATIILGFSAAAAIKTAVVSLALGLASQALMPKPKTPDLGSRGQTVSVRDPVASRKIVYGETKVSGPPLFIHARAQNGILHVVIPVAAHQIESVVEFWADDEKVPVTLSSEGWYVPTSGRFFTGAGHTGEDGSQHWVQWRVHLGTDDQAADPKLVGVGGWTSEHRLRGVAYVHVKLIGNFRDAPDIWPNGMPNLAFTVRGKKVYDPRTGTTAWSRNAALCFRDYLVTPRSKGGYGATAAEIDEANMIGQANICDEAVPLTAGGTEPRYRLDGVVDTAWTPQAIIEQMLTACAGMAKDATTGGQWKLFVGAWRAPTIPALTDDDLDGPIRVQTRISRRDLFNGIKGRYLSEANAWTPADYPAVKSDTAMAEQGVGRKWRDFDQPFTRSAAQAQRIAKIQLLKVLQPITIVASCKLTAFRVQVGDVIPWTDADYGWTAKPFEVTEWRLVARSDANGQRYLGVDLALRETAAAIYDWSTSEEQAVDPAPNTTLPTVRDVAAPEGVALSSGTDELLVAGDGTIISRIRVEVVPSGDAFVSRYDLQAKLSSAASWADAAPLTGGSLVSYIAPVRDGSQYDVRVRAVNVLGVPSAWVTAAPHVVVGKSALPPAVDSFAVARLADGTRRFSWSASEVPADVRVGGGYRIRYSLGATGDWSTMTALHTGLLTVSPFETNELAAGVYTFALKAVDSSGNESAEALFISATLGDPRLRNVLLARDERQLGWPGTKGSGYVDTDGVLRAVTAGGWTALPASWNALSARWETILPNASPMTYTSPVMDIGTDATFSPLVTPQGEGAVTIEMRTGTAAEGTVAGAWEPVAQAVGKRYVQIRVGVAGSAPALSGLMILLDAETVVDEYEDLDTATAAAAWFVRNGPGDVTIASRSGKLASISTATITALQGVGAGWTWSLVSKSLTVGGQPAARFCIYNSAGVMSDALVDLELKGPKK